MSRLDAAARLQLERRVLDLEAANGGAVALLVARDCGGYESAGWRCGALLAALAALAAGVAAGGLTPTAIAAWWGGGLLAGHLAARQAPVRRLFVSERDLRERVARRAERAHAALDLGANGLLVLVAGFEQRVAVRAGAGLASRLPVGRAWQAIATALAAPLRRGAVEAALDAALAEAAPLLARAGVAPQPPRLAPRIVVED